MGDDLLEFRMFTLAPADERSVPPATPIGLPAVLSDYRRSPQDLMIAAVGPDERVVGKGFGWTMARGGAADLLWVHAVEVDPPYADTDLARHLVDLLLAAAHERRMSIGIAAEVTDVIARHGGDAPRPGLQ